MASYKKNLNLIKEHLQNNESIITSIEVTYEKNDWIRKGVLVSTENRIIFLAKKLIGFDLESFPFGNISSYEYGKEFMGHKIKFFASGNEIKVKWIESKNLNEFNQYINSNIGQQSNSKEFIQPESVASQLEKLATLLEKNLISEDEFYKMKSEITSNGKEKNITYKQETSKSNFTKSESSENIKPKKSKFKQILKYTFLIFFVVPIVIGIISIAFSNNESPKYDNHKIKYAKSHLNIRNRPIVNDNILKVLKPNEKVITYDSIVNNYIMILDTDSTKIGWASNKYLQKKPLTKVQSKEIIKKTNQTNPNIISIWKDNDATLPCEIYLIKESDKFKLKTLFTKNEYSEESEIIENIVKTEINGEIRLTSNNPHGEYYVIEKNGNLGIYNTDGKFKEAVKLN